MLPPTATQQDVFNQAGVKEVIDDVLNGYNGTVMAYGQTGGTCSRHLLLASRRRSGLAALHTAAPLQPALPQLRCSLPASAGAGKTHTLGNTDPHSIGMIPRALLEIFNKAKEDPFHRQVAPPAGCSETLWLGSPLRANTAGESALRAQPLDTA